MIKMPTFTLAVDVRLTNVKVDIAQGQKETERVREIESGRERELSRENNNDRS